MSAPHLTTLRKDDLNRFYTRDVIGNIMIDELGDLDNKIFLDLGVGDGSLTRSVFKRWNNATGVTVDLDQECNPNLKLNNSISQTYKHFHYVDDVLQSNLKKISERYEAFDLAVCNPPFFKPKWKKEHCDFLDEVNLLGALPRNADINAELIFLAQNLRLLGDGGMLAIILPDNIITGHRFSRFRTALTRKHCIEKVIQLPSRSCHWTEARCFILFVSKNLTQKQNIKLSRLDSEQNISPAISIPFELAHERLDYDYHVTRLKMGDNGSNLKILGAEVRRGSLSSVQARNASFSTFHTSDYNKIDQDGTITFSERGPGLSSNKQIICLPGDILMARVDRNLHKKVAMVKSGSAAITDCVYRVRLPVSIREKAFRVLRSEEGGNALQAISKGVGARLLGKADLLHLPLNIEKTPTSSKNIDAKIHTLLF